MVARSRLEAGELRVVPGRAGGEAGVDLPCPASQRGRCAVLEPGDRAPALRVDGPATATDLAVRLGTNSGATSYHLRKLESVGLVADTGDGEGKRRLWRAATDFHTFDASDFDGDADSESALNWLVRDYARHFSEQLDKWLDAEGAWPLARSLYATITEEP